jgi:hypothetical protein
LVDPAPDPALRQTTSQTSANRESVEIRVYSATSSIVMGPKKHPVWEYFGPTIARSGAKTLYCHCSACNSEVVAAIERLRTQWHGCKTRPRGIGALEVGLFRPAKASKNVSSQLSTMQSMNFVTSWPQPSSSVPAADDTKLNTYSYGRAHFGYLMREKMEQLQVLFGRAMHRGSTPFTTFQTPHWVAFFLAFRNSFNIPSPDAIGGVLMRGDYQNVMSASIQKIAQWMIICMTLVAPPTSPVSRQSI